MRKNKPVYLFLIYAMYFFLPLIFVGLRFMGLFFVIWLVSMYFYIGIKIALLRLGGIKISEIYFGLPIALICKGKLFDIPCTYSALPVFPIIHYAPPQRDRITASVWFGIKHVVINLITPVLLIALVSSSYFYMLNPPESHNNVVVASLPDDSTLGRQGLREGDTLVLFGDKRVTDVKQVPTLVKELGEDSTMMLFLRNGRYLAPIVTAFPEKAGEPYLGIAFKNVPAERDIVIQDVKRGSSADLLGLKWGDTILEVDGHPVKEIAEVLEVVARSESGYLTVRVKRGEEALPPARLKKADGKKGRREVGLKIASRIVIKPQVVYIQDILEDSPAQGSLEAGDILLELDSKILNSGTDMTQKRLAKHGRNIPLKVIRNNEIKTVLVTPSVIKGNAGVTLGIQYQVPQVFRIKLSDAVRRGASYTLYACTIPFQLPGQLIKGFVDPYGIYNVWNIWITTANDYMKLQSTGRTSFNFRALPFWFKIKITILFLIMYMLGILVPFMITFEYINTAYSFVMMFRTRLVRYVASSMILVLVAGIVFLMMDDPTFMRIYELPYVEDYGLLSWSVWAI